MNFRLSILVFGLLIFLALLPFTSDLLQALMRSFFEGTSYGKTLAFIFWAAFFFALNFLKEKKSLKPLSFKNSELILAGLVVFLWVLQILWHLSILSQAGLPGLPAETIASAVIETPRGLEWQASQLVHVHASKAALTPLLEMLPFKAVDTGLPLLHLTPFPGLNFAFLFLAIILLALIVNEFFSLKSSRQELLFVFISFALMVSIFDGGPFSVVGKISLGLLTAFILLKRKEKSELKIFFLPFMVIAGFAYLWSFFLESYAFIFSSYEILLLALMLALILAWRSRNQLKLGWPLKSAFFIFLALLCLYFFQPKLADFVWGETIHAGQENKIMVYGLPQGISLQQVEKLAENFGQVEKVELHGYMAFLSLKPSKNTGLKLLEEKFKSELKPESYLFAVKGVEEHQAEIFSSSDLSPLLIVESDFISFKEIEVNGVKRFTGESFFLHPYINLFAGSYLLQESEAEKEIVFSLIR